jgi:hypothetical protein
VSTLAQRMPHLLLGMAAFVLASWWVLARGGEENQRQPPPAQQDSSSPDVAAGCDVCSGCSGVDCGDCACDLGDACSACDIGGCDCIAVPPGALTHTFDAAAEPGVRGRDRPRGDRRLGPQAWASLGLLVPLAVMFFWRRRR